ncbi:RPII140-upstream gene protein [Colletes gigas]|uniref:RPII140-upstream gene protein n=1 Tax=Colletes gigas TaxID=935657 RepID=UPI001C9B73F0|nr:RPII140-upstream gene protein [Colletes gigas]
MYRMFRTAINKRLLYANLIPLSWFNLNQNSPDDQEKEDLAVKRGEIGMDRLKKMFSLNEYGEISKEMLSIINTTTSGFIGGFLIGGTMKSRFVPRSFIAENQVTKFQNVYDAQQQLRYNFVREFFKGGRNLAMKLGVFCFLFQGTFICLQVYRGKQSMINYTCAGAVTGCLFKLNMGIRGAISGSIFGAILGSMYGSITFLTLYLTGFDTESVYNTEIKLMESRKEAITRRAKAYMGSEVMGTVGETDTLVTELKKEDNKK